jgi:hypothetical protein
MIDTLKFFKANYDSKSYYSKFHSQLASIHDEQFVYSDRQEVIERFRHICKPPEIEFENNNNEFLLLAFWLNKNMYVIKEFPNLLSRPSSLYNFAYNDFRKYIRKERGVDGDVLWSERRELCDNLSITSNASYQLLPDDMEEKIRLISTRNAEFDGMAVDEKLQNLNNLIENLLKPRSKGSYLSIDYDDVFFGFISEGDVKQFRKRTQPFRHATEDTLRERASIPESEKKLLAELGVFIAVHLHNHLSNRVTTP